MVKSDLEKVIIDTNRKLDEGIKVFVKDYRSRDMIVNGLISGAAFMVGSMVIQEIKHAHIRHKNKKWVKANKES